MTVQNEQPKKTKTRLTLLLALLFVACLVAIFVNRDQLSKPLGGSKSNTTTQKPFNKKQFSIDDPSSQWVIVNKVRPLNPKTYEPSLTVPTVPLRLSSDDGEMHVATMMAPALESLIKAASAANVTLMLASGYRSYDEQVGVYGSEVQSNGQSSADRESARPGYSEHQTGLAADLEPTNRQCEVELCFGSLAEGKWLAANAAQYGFIIRYPQNKESITGYVYEPWHVRYVGIPLAKELTTKHIDTLETFFGLGAAPTYK